MKKTLMTCVGVIGLLAIAGSAGAITCTIDQRPAATLLVPYFETAFNPDQSVVTGTNARDTLVTICNASAAPMIAHVNVFNERTQLVLDFNIALTGYDCQSWGMASLLSGNLPRTGAFLDSVAGLDDVCQRNPDAPVYPDTDGFIRVRPGNPARPTDDNTLATTLYPQPAWTPGSLFASIVLDSLDSTPDAFACKTGAVDGVLSGPIRGYITIDHANYCNLSNPNEVNYYINDAIGNENNLFGEVLFTSGSGLPTMGGSTVNIEADASLDGGGIDPAGATGGLPRRTFYRRYWSATTEVRCSNCGSGNPETDLDISSPWNTGLGDRREPLGLKYAARWFQTGIINSFLNVWRGSSGDPFPGQEGEEHKDLGGPVTSGGPQCTASLPAVTLTFFNEDEDTVSQGTCPSPPVGCIPSFPFPLETQRVPVTSFARPAGPAGWVNMSFFTNATENGGRLDQAWVEYDFQGPGALLSASAPGTQLDPTTCQPLGVTGVTTTAPAIPTIVGTGK